MLVASLRRMPCWPQYQWTANHRSSQVGLPSRAVHGPALAGIPPHLLPLCEIIRGEKTEEAYLQQMYELVKGLGKKPVIVKKDVNGFILNRLQYAVLREALYLVENDVASL